MHSEIAMVNHGAGPDSKEPTRGTNQHARKLLGFGVLLFFFFFFGTEVITVV